MDAQQQAGGRDFLSRVIASTPGSFQSPPTSNSESQMPPQDLSISNSTVSPWNTTSNTTSNTTIRSISTFLTSPSTPSTSASISSRSISAFQPLLLALWGTPYPGAAQCVASPLSGRFFCRALKQPFPVSIWRPSGHALEIYRSVLPDIMTELGNSSVSESMPSPFGVDP